MLSTASDRRPWRKFFTPSALIGLNLISTLIPLADPAHEPRRHVDQRASRRACRPEVLFELTGMEANFRFGRIDVALPVNDHLGSISGVGDGIDAPGERTPVRAVLEQRVNRPLGNQPPAQRRDVRSCNVRQAIAAISSASGSLSSSGSRTSSATKSRARLAKRPTSSRSSPVSTSSSNLCKRRPRTRPAPTGRSTSSESPASSAMASIACGRSGS